MRRRFDLYLDCDNAAFETSTVGEIRRLLKMVRWMLGQVLERGGPASLPILDVNGNRVGKWEYSVLPDTVKVLGLCALWPGDVLPPKGWLWATANDGPTAGKRLIIRNEENV